MHRRQVGLNFVRPPASFVIVNRRSCFSRSLDRASIRGILIRSVSSTTLTAATRSRFGTFTKYPSRFTVSPAVTMPEISRAGESAPGMPRTVGRSRRGRLGFARLTMVVWYAAEASRQRNRDSRSEGTVRRLIMLIRMPRRSALAFYSGALNDDEAGIVET